MRRFVLLVAGLALLAGVAATVSGGATQAEARWVITDLGTLGGNETRPGDINERGQIVGMSQTSTGSYHAFLWQGGRMRDLGTLGGSDSAALGINEHGQVVGWAYTASGTPHGFLWENGEIRDLGTAAGYRDSAAGLVNERGQVVGVAMNRYLQGVPADQRALLWEDREVHDLGKLPDYGYMTVAGLNNRGQVVGTGFDTLDDRQPGSMLDGQAFVWANGTLLPLATPGESGRSEAVGINERGQVIGVCSRIFRRETRSVLWQGGRARILGALGGKWSRPTDISESGTIVGWASKAGVRADGGPIWHAFLWQGGRMRDLGTLGGSSSWAGGINEHGQVVGWASKAGVATDGGPIWHAVLWEHGRLTDLGTLGGPRSTAWLITERGQLVGQSETKGGAWHAVLWTLKR